VKTEALSQTLRASEGVFIGGGMDKFNITSPFHKDRFSIINEDLIKHNTNVTLKKIFRKEVGIKHYNRLEIYFNEYFSQLLNIANDHSKNLLRQFHDILLCGFIARAFQKLWFSKNNFKNQSGEKPSKKEIQTIIKCEIDNILEERFFFADLVVFVSTNSVDELASILQKVKTKSKAHMLKDDSDYKNIIDKYMSSIKMSERRACKIVYDEIKKKDTDKVTDDFASFHMSFRNYVVEDCRKNDKIVQNFLQEREKRNKKKYNNKIPKV